MIGSTIDITIQKTIAEAMEEIENKLYIGMPLSTDTMLLAWWALKEQNNDT